MSIKVNVQGTIFETTSDTIKKINLFKYMLEATDYNSTEPLFINRPAHIFKHVLAFVTTNNYKYPLKYKKELDFYGINYNANGLYDPNKKVEQIYNKVYDLSGDLQDLHEQINDVTQQKLNEIIENSRYCYKCTCN